MPIARVPETPADSVDTLFRDTETVILYKHSFECGLSSIAMDQVNAFTDAHPDIPILLVDVIGQRPLSRALAAHLSVEHESPQAIVVRDGVAVWHASHRKVTATSLAEAWQEHAAA